jgi:hypothetical protein
MGRVVKIRLDQERIASLVAEKGRHVHTAIGYLSTWAIGGYDQVTIWPDRDPEDMVAEYRDTKTDRVYVIGAVWDSDRQEYGFHS